MSRGFVSTLAGLAITFFSWFSSWSWPAWPAFAVLDLLSSIPPAFAAEVLVLCLIVNVFAWAMVCFAVQCLLARWRSLWPA